MHQKILKKYISYFPLSDTLSSLRTVFGHIEKVTKRMDTIISPKEYLDTFADAGIVYQLGKEEVKVFDWKSAATENIKLPGNWHFKFQPTKRISFNKTKSGNILIKDEVHYRSDLGNFQGICKKGKKFSMINPLEIEPGQVTVNPKKVRDVDNLLKKHFGDLASRSFFRLLQKHN